MKFVIAVLSVFVYIRLVSCMMYYFKHKKIVASAVLGIITLTAVVFQFAKLSL